MSKTYTMVYAPSTPLGRAKVVACKRDVMVIDELVDEAAALWAAEQRDESQPTRGELHSGHWGCVALLPYPDSSVSGNLLDEWAQRVSKERPGGSGAKNYDAKKYDVRGQSAINDRGILQIPWPDCSDTGSALGGFDILLATATKPIPDPSTGDFVSATVIAEAWNKTRDASYFHSNREHGFLTFQDEEIISRLRV